MMTIDEAIKHCEEVAEKYDTELNLINCGISNESCDNCLECAEEHRQLAEWLKELKAYKKAYTEIDSKIESDYMGNNEYEMAVSDGYQGAINIIDRCIEEVKADEERSESK